MVFQQLSGINAVMFYAETIFEEAKFKVKRPLACLFQIPCGCGLVPGSVPDPARPSPQDSSLASVIVGVIQVLFTAVAALVMDRAGRRLLLAVSGEARGRGLSPEPMGWPRIPTACWRAFAQATMLWKEAKRS